MESGKPKTSMRNRAKSVSLTMRKKKTVTSEFGIRRQTREMRRCRSAWEKPGPGVPVVVVVMFTLVILPGICHT